MKEGDIVRYIYKPFIRIFMTHRKLYKVQSVGITFGVKYIIVLNDDSKLDRFVLEAFEPIKSSKLPVWF